MINFIILKEILEGIVIYNTIFNTLIFSFILTIIVARTYKNIIKLMFLNMTLLKILGLQTNIVIWTLFGFMSAINVVKSNRFQGLGIAIQKINLNPIKGAGLIESTPIRTPIRSYINKKKIDKELSQIVNSLKKKQLKKELKEITMSLQKKNNEEIIKQYLERLNTKPLRNEEINMIRKEAENKLFNIFLIEKGKELVENFDNLHHMQKKKLLKTLQKKYQDLDEFKRWIRRKGNYQDKEFKLLYDLYKNIRYNKKKEYDKIYKKISQYMLEK